MIVVVFRVKLFETPLCCLIVGKKCWSENNQMDVTFLDVLVYFHVLVFWRKISSVENLVDLVISRTVVFTHVMGGVHHQDLCLVGRHFRHKG
jgi:hypothetical protein